MIIQSTNGKGEVARENTVDSYRASVSSYEMEGSIIRGNSYDMSDYGNTSYTGIKDTNNSNDNFFNIANLGDNLDEDRDKDNGLGDSDPIIYPESDVDDLDPLNEYGAESGVSDSARQDQEYKTASRVFLAISVVSAVCILLFEAYIYAAINIHKANLHSKDSYAELSVYLALFIFAAIYQVVLTIVGLRTKNMLLLAMLCMFYGCMVIYTGIQFEEIKKLTREGLKAGWKHAIAATNIATIAVLSLTLIAQVLLLYFVLQKNVKWFRYKKIGGDFRIKRMYTLFQIHRALLIFDFFFFLGFTIQFVVIMVKDKSSVEFILTVCVLPLTILLLLAADIAGSRELVYLTLATIVVFVCGIAYVLFKIIRLYTKYTSAFLLTINPGDYFPGRKSLLTFGVLTLVLLVTTICFEITLILNYNHGLLPLVSTYYSMLPGHQSPDARRHHPVDISM